MTPKLVVGRTLLQEVKHLIETSGKQVQRRHDTAVGTQVETTIDSLPNNDSFITPL